MVLEKKISNCFFEMVKAKIKDPLNVKIGYLAPEINDNELHFWWINIKEGNVYHFVRRKGLGPIEFILPGKGRLHRAYLGQAIDYIIEKCYLSNKNVEDVIKYAKKAGLKITLDEAKRGYEVFDNLKKEGKLAC